MKTWTLTNSEFSLFFYA